MAFDRDDGTHRWEPLRPDGEWPANWGDPVSQGVMWIFLEAARKHREPPDRTTFARGKPRPSLQRLLERFTGSSGGFQIRTPRILPRNSTKDSAQHVCSKCRSTTEVQPGGIF